MSPRSLLSSIRPSGRRLVVGLTAAALAVGLSACEVKVGASDDGSSASPQSTPVVAVNDGTANVEVGGDGSVSVDDGNGNSVNVNPGGSVTAQASDGATVSAEASAGASQASQGAGGSGAQITDSDWLSALSSVDQTIAPSNGMVVLDDSETYDTIRIDGAATTLTVKGDYVTVVGTQANQIVIEGDYAHVYVENMQNVTITGDYATVVWAGQTPQINDSGSFNETRPQK